MLILAATLWFSQGFAGALAATAAAETPPVTVAPSATVADTITQFFASEELQRAALARLEQAGQWRELDERDTALEARLDALAASAAAQAESVDPLSLDRQLRTLHRDAATVVDDLAAIVRRLEYDRNALEEGARKWQEQTLFLANQLVPASVLEHARSLEAKLKATSARVREYRDNVVLALDRALVLQVRIDDARARIAAEQERVHAQRLQMQELPLWRLDVAAAQFHLVAVELRSTWRSLQDYLVRGGVGLGGVFFGALALTFWLFTRKEGAGTGSRAYGRPVAASLLIALMSLWWLALDPPVLFYEALLFLVPIPAAMVARNALPAKIPLTLYGIAVATMLLVLRREIDASAIADRLLLLLQALSIAVPIAVDLSKGRLRQALPQARPGTVRSAALFVIVVALITLFDVIFGFTGPTRSLRAGMGSVLGFGLVFGTTAVVVYGAAVALLSAPIVRWFHSARNADPALLRTVRLVVSAMAIAGVAALTLGTLDLLPTVRSALESLMGATLEVGTVSFAAKAVATSLAVAIATFVLTGLTGFILDREIVPRLRLRPGAGYAMVTFTRWTIVIVGTVLTLAALGIDMAKVTLLASAVGVGIGFGLQNIVNNFVSGVILIVERPVGVGDLIEVGPLTGEVKRIGIRSSVVRTFQGAEVIVPNAELVSKEVVNWTRSDRQRRYDIDVGVAYGSEPQQVMRLLVEAAGDVPEIMKSPAPLAMFKGFGDSSLDFRLLAWVHTVDVGLEAQNALRVAILRKLEEAGIAIPFPQRDVHIHSADDRARPVTG